MDQNFVDNHVGVSVHAGFPNPGEDRSQRSLDLHQLLVKRPASTFLFTVAGNAWASLGINDGDVAVVDRSLGAQPNDLVIWWGRGEFAASAFHRLPRGAVLWGVVTAVAHQFRKAER